MAAQLTQIWTVLMALAALGGWWLAVRPGASYGGISTTMSRLIVLMAILMCVLAVG